MLLRRFICPGFNDLNPAFFPYATFNERTEELCIFQTKSFEYQRRIVVF